MVLSKDPSDRPVEERRSGAFKAPLAVAHPTMIKNGGGARDPQIPMCGRRDQRVRDPSLGLMMLVGRTACAGVARRDDRAKSSPGDAKVLADLVRTDRANRRPVASDSDLAAAVKVLARTHQNLIW